MTAKEEETNREKQKAVEQLEESGLFSKEELEFAATYMEDEATEITVKATGFDHATSSTIRNFTTKTATGMLPRRVGELLGINGNSLQIRCGTGSVKAERSLIGWWIIPPEEIIRLRRDKITRGKK